MLFLHKYFPLSLTVAEVINLDFPSSKVRDFDTTGSPSSRDHSCMFISEVQLRVTSSPSVIPTFLTSIVGLRVGVVGGSVVGLSKTQKSYEQTVLKKRKKDEQTNNNKSTAIRTTKLY